MTPITTSQSTEQVTAACDKMIAAELNRDLEAVLDLIWDDAVWLAPNAPPVLGIAEIRSLFAEFFQLPFTDMTVDLTSIRVSESGDLATVWGTFALTFDSPEGQSTESMNFLMSWENRDGNWKTAANMFCTNTPLPQAE